MALYRHRCPLLGSGQKLSGAIVRFVDSSFDEQKTRSEIQRLFGTVKMSSTVHCPFAPIFLAMARKSEEA